MYKKMSPKVPLRCQEKEKCGISIGREYKGNISCGRCESTLANGPGKERKKKRKIRLMHMSPDVDVVFCSPQVNESRHTPPRAPLVTYALRVRTIASRGRTAAATS